MTRFNTYANLLARMESGNNCQKINNNSGALGKYQFLPSRLDELMQKYSLPMWYNYFISDCYLQDRYFKAHVADLLAFINANNLKANLGQEITGSKRFPGLTAKLTLEGLLAGMHLAGPTGTQNYFLTGNNPDDGFTSLTDYMAYFSNEFKSNLSYSLAGLAIICLIILYYT